jgi:hypothetical protein
MGFAAAAPAATTAFGSTAFWAGTAAAAPITSSLVMPSIFTTAASSGGGLLSSFSLAKLLPTMQQLSPLMYWGSQAFGTASTIRSGNIQSNMYDLQNLQLQANLNMKQLNHEQTSLERLRKLKQINAANLARAYSGGVSGLDGSTKLLETVSGQEYSKDYGTALAQFRTDMVNGNIQSDIYQMAGQEAVNGAYLDAAAKLGNAAYMYSRIGGPPSTAQG